MNYHAERFLLQASKIDLLEKFRLVFKKQNVQQMVLLAVAE